MQTYHETFSSALNAVEESLEIAGITLQDPEGINPIRHMADSPLNYEETRRGDFAIATLNGKPTRKYFHVSLYRLHTGRYEITTYIL